MLKPVLPEAFKDRRLIVWGYPEGTHTHSYIHRGFWRAADYLGMVTLWHHKDNMPPLEFYSERDVFIAGTEDTGIPTIKGALYFLHNSTNPGFKGSGAEVIDFQVYSTSVPVRKLREIGPLQYVDPAARCIYQPWATDLLPGEFDYSKLCLDNVPGYCAFIGSIFNAGLGRNDDMIQAFEGACLAEGLAFIKDGLYTKTLISDEHHIDLIRKATLAPALQGQFQLNIGYIPCRIFKNMSYGQIGLTNSQSVKDMLGDHVIYYSNPADLFHAGMLARRSWNADQLCDAMKEIEQNHTYVNRLLNMFELALA